MLKKYSLLIVFVVVVLTSSTVFAQGGPGVPPPDTPIDGGLGILLALGIGYAVKKLRKKD